MCACSNLLITQPNYADTLKDTQSEFIYSSCNPNIQHISDGICSYWFTLEATPNRTAPKYTCARNFIYQPAKQLVKTPQNKDANTTMIE